MPDLGRPDIIPIRGGIPGEYWFWQERFDGGASARRYKRPYSQRLRADTETTADGRFGFLILDVASAKSLTWTAEAADVWGVFEENGQILVGNGQVVKLIANPVTEDVDFAATDVDANTYNGLAIWERSNAEVALVGTGSHIFSRNATWSNAAVATEQLVVAPDRLWKSYASSGSYLVANCLAGTDPLTGGNWSSGIRVGDASKPINGLAVLGDELLVGTTEGLYGVTADGVVFKRTKDIVTHANNGKGTTSCLGYVVYPTQDNGVYLYRDGSIYPNEGPEILTEQRELQVTMEYFIESGGWIYAAGEDEIGQSVSLFRARLRLPTDEPGGILKWFPWQYQWQDLATTRFAALHVSDIDVDSVTQRMLWVATDGVAHGFNHYTRTPFDTLESANAYSTGALADTGVFWFPNDDLGFPFANKMLRSAIVHGRQIDSTAKAEVIGEFDEGSAWAALSLTATNTAVNFGATGTTGKVLTDWGLRIYDNAGGLRGPIIERFGMGFFVRPNNERIFTLRLWITGEHTGDPVEIAETAETQMTNLLALSENVVTISFGSSVDDYTVLFSPDVEFRLEKDTDGEYQLVGIVTCSVI